MHFSSNRRDCKLLAWVWFLAVATLAASPLGDGAAARRGKGSKKDDLLDEEKWKMIHHVVQAGHVEQLRVLHKGGMGVDLKNPADGTSPAHIAALHGHVPVLKYLKHASVDLEAREHSGAEPVHAAAYRGHRSVLKYLKEARVNFRARDNGGGDPVSAAQAGGHKSIVKFLAKAIGGAIRNEDL